MIVVNHAEAGKHVVVDANEGNATAGNGRELTAAADVIMAESGQEEETLRDGYGDGKGDGHDMVTDCMGTETAAALHRERIASSRPAVDGKRTSQTSVDGKRTSETAVDGKRTSAKQEGSEFGLAQATDTVIGDVRDALTRQSVALLAGMAACCLFVYVCVNSCVFCNKWVGLLVESRGMYVRHT
jgi:hypothetical protein